MNKNYKKKIEPEVINNCQWFAIQTYTLKEHIAKVNFENQGFKVYLPEIQVVSKHARRVDLVKKAFFPGYLFLHLGSTERKWRTIASTRGVIGPVKFGNYFPPVPDWVIEDLILCLNEKGLISNETLSKEKLKPGDKVKVNLHDALERIAVFKAFRGNDRALILLDILRSQVPTVVPLSSLTQV